MKLEDFELFSTIIKQRSGFILTRDRAYLLESRLMPVARKWKLKTLEDMARDIRVKREDNMLADITEAVTDNESRFFRDRWPFDQFQRTLLPQLLISRANKKQIRIWSSAMAGGHEPYTLAMICCDENEKLKDWKIDILGSDISPKMVEHAKNGLFSQFDVQRGISIRKLIKHFQLASPDRWQAKDHLRQMIQFRECNLLHDFGPVGVFDIIYCRNVLLHFDQTTKSRVLAALSTVLAPDGVLILGNDETVVGISNKLKALEAQPGIFALSTAQTTIATRQAS